MCTIRTVVQNLDFPAHFYDNIPLLFDALASRKDLSAVGTSSNSSQLSSCSVSSELNQGFVFDSSRQSDGSADMTDARLTGRQSGWVLLSVTVSITVCIIYYCL